MVRYDASYGAQGALTGASIGTSILPGYGTAAGAAIGSTLGFFAPRKKKKKISTLDKQQQQLYGQYHAALQGQGQFADMFNYNPQQDTDYFNKSIAAPAYQNYKENVVPTITGAFRGGNLGKSSYLGGALGKAGSDVQKNLDAQLSQMLSQGHENALNRRVNAVNSLLNMQTFAQEKPQPSPLDTAISGFSEGAGKAGGEAFSRWLQNTYNSKTKTPATPGTP